MINFEKLGKVVYFHRRKSKLTRMELARLSGVGKDSIFKIEKGQGNVSLKILMSIFEVLNIQIDLKSPLMNEFMESDK